MLGIFPENFFLRKLANAILRGNFLETVKTQKFALTENLIILIPYEYFKPSRSANLGETFSVAPWFNLKHEGAFHS